MKTSDLSKTYARLLFDLASTTDVVDSVDKDLKTLVATVADSVQLREALSDESVSSEAKRAITAELFAGCVPEVVAIADLTMERAGIEALYALRREFVEISEHERGIIIAEVTTALPLEGVQREALEKKLSAEFERPVVLSESIDASIIGGIRISVAGRVLDGTVSSQLSAVRNALSKASQGGEV